MRVRGDSSTEGLPAERSDSLRRVLPGLSIAISVLCVPLLSGCYLAVFGAGAGAYFLSNDDGGPTTLEVNALPVVTRLEVAEGTPGSGRADILTDVLVSFVVSELTSESSSVRVEFSTNGTDYLLASLEGSNPFELPSESLGVRQEVSWQANSNLGDGYHSDVRVRITATDSDGSGSEESTFSLGNDLPVVEDVRVVERVGGEPLDEVSGTVVVTCQLSDTAGDRSNIEFFSRRPGGEFVLENANVVAGGLAGFPGVFLCASQLS
ncbi:MAG: hypothetical protein AAF517_04410 [Planctomycetota bacterium]